MDIHPSALLAPLDVPLAIVDLETTGTYPAHDRVTEIAVLEVERGEVAAEWSTLLNPQTAIPPAVQALTGITQSMVSGAPTFGDLAAELHARLEGRLFVAHNARFDYGFLREEFLRAGIRFQARTLCTVRLSRRLYPEEPRHNLDSVIARHHLACGARHRALGDAQAVWGFLRAAASERGGEALATAVRQLARQQTLPPHIDRAVIDAIPESPGVYLFYGEGGVPLYVGKSIGLRSRVLRHFADDLRSSREMQLAREVRSIEWQRTAGELGALLREAELVKTLLPVFNRRLRRARDLCGFSLEGDALSLAFARDLAAGEVSKLRGLFRSRRAALEALRGLADEHALCLQTLGFEPGARSGAACFRHQVRRCAGVCAGRESPRTHAARVAGALARLQSATWPYRGAIGIVERDTEREVTDIHVVRQWTWLGCARSEDELAELLQPQRRPAFDLDQYRLLARHLATGRARVVDL